MGSVIFGARTQQPKPRKYLFIDGNYFQMTVSSQSKRIGENIQIPIDYERLSKGFTRVIYYDSLPVKKKNQSDSEFEEVYTEKQNFLNHLRLLPNYHVRDGFTRMRPRANGGIEQKGVDTWLAIEVLQYAFRNIIDVAEIITGDLDLYPLFEALLQTNTTGVLHYEKGHTSNELIMSADQSHPITTSKLLEWSDSKFELKYQAKQNQLISQSVIPLLDVQETSYGECVARYDSDNEIWQANFKGIGNVLTASSRLLLIDYLNKFIGKNIISDDAFKE